MSGLRLFVKASKANISSIRHYSNFPNINFSRLSNGLGVLSVERSSGLTTLGVSFHAGSAFETRATNGVSSILQSAQSANSDGSFSSLLSREQLAFYGYADPGKEGAFLTKLNSSLPFNLTAESFEGGQSLALSTLGSTSSGFDNLLNHLHTVSYQDGPHGLPLNGTVQSIPEITLEKAQAFAEQYLVASRGVVTSVGPLKHSQLEALANETFGRLPTGVTRHTWSPYTGSMVKIADDNRTDTEMLFGYGGPGTLDEEHEAVQLVTHLTGEWSKFKNGGHGSVSRIVDDLVHDKLGLEMRSFYLPYAQLGLFGVYITANYDMNVREVIPKGAIQYFVQLGQYLTDNEVARGKAKYSNSYLKRYNSTKRSFLELSREVHDFGKPRRIEESLERIHSLTKDNVKQILQKFTYDVDVSVSASGQLYQFPDYNFLRNWTFWYRL